jgi:hypothetical protein
MKPSFVRHLVLTAVALVLSVAATGTASAQTLDSSQATDFLGSWAILLTSPDGEVPFVLSLVDKAGKVEATVGTSPTEGMVIQDLSKTGDEIVAKYTMPYQGMQLPVVMSLKREGANLQTSWDFMEGAYTTTAVGTRQ